MSQPIGLIGLGAMGRGMAQSLRRAGYLVHVCDVRPEAAQTFAAEGGVACATRPRWPRGATSWSAWSSTQRRPRRVLFGEHGAAAAMKPGQLFVMCSTVDPNVSIAFEQRLAERGVLYLDAPISGGAAKAASRADDDDDCRPARGLCQGGRRARRDGRAGLPARRQSRATAAR